MEQGFPQRFRVKAATLTINSSHLEAPGKDKNVVCEHSFKSFFTKNAFFMLLVIYHMKLHGITFEITLVTSLWYRNIL